MVSGVFSICFDADSEVPAEPPHIGLNRVPVRQYIGGRENRLVKVAAESLLRTQPVYNPLFFCGRTGTGKTLLAEGLAEQWRVHQGVKGVQVICGADFARAYANAVDTQGLADFRRRFRQLGFLAIDDIHEMQQKPAAQRELARTLDALLASGAVVLATSTTPPTENHGFFAGLRSRLSAGLVVPLTTPGPEARQLLLRRFASLHEIKLTDDALTLLADRLHAQHSTVPDLNRAILQLSHAVEPTAQPVAADFVRHYLNEHVCSNALQLPAIAQQVARFFSVSVRDLRGPLRRRQIVRARGVAMYIAWHLTDKSLDAIGKYFGKRDHTTVLHACRRTETLLDTDPAIEQAISQLAQRLEST